jgi:hypothetical protein
LNLKRQARDLAQQEVIESAVANVKKTVSESDEAKKNVKF